MSESFSAVYKRLSLEYPDILTLDELAKILRKPSANAIYILFHRGELPVRLRELGGQYRCLLVDAALFAATGEPQEQILPRRTKIAKTPGKKMGRRTNAERKALRETEGRE